MLRKGKWPLLAALGLAACNTGPSQADDTIEVSVQVVRRDRSPIVGLPVRVVVGTEKDARAPNAGARLVTDANGRVFRSVRGNARKRSVTLDNVFVRHRMDSIDVGVEMKLLGRPALYWVELDSNRVGTLGGMAAYVSGRSGRFDRQIKRHPKYSYLWAFPDDPNGRPLEGTGANLRLPSAESTTDANGARRWKIDFVLETEWEPTP